MHKPKRQTENGIRRSLCSVSQHRKKMQVNQRHYMSSIPPKKEENHFLITITNNQQRVLIQKKRMDSKQAHLTQTNSHHK